MIAHDMVGGNKGASPIRFWRYECELIPEAVGQPRAYLPNAVAEPDIRMKKGCDAVAVSRQFSQQPPKQLGMAPEE